MILSLLIYTSCNDLVTVRSPGTQLVQEVVFQSEGTATAALMGAYAGLTSGYSFADGNLNSVTVFEGLYADELLLYTPPTSVSGALRTEFFLNSVLPTNSVVLSAWTTAYKTIYESNRIIEGLNNSVGITNTVKNSLMGEALFLRAFCHFYLVNLFGDVPLLTTSDYRVNAIASRTPVQQVYAQIIIDLEAARTLLSDQYIGTTRGRVNKGAVIALLARAYLYTGDYGKAEAEATEVIGMEQYQLEPNLNSVFLTTSKEAIWQLAPNGGIQNYTHEGSLFILLSPPTTWALRSELIQAFEPEDVRKVQWIGKLVSSSGNTTWYFPYKYKQTFNNASGNEYSMVLRLAEQYLIRAEARAIQNKLTGPNSAEADINIIRARAGLPNTSAASQSDLLLAIGKERRVEFFTEWGHRFLDLKRTGRLETALKPLKPDWDNTDALLPLPQNELLLNQNLKPQNPGY